MKSLKKIVGIILSLVLVCGTVLPNIKADATGNIEKVEAKYHGTMVEGMKAEPDTRKMEYIFTFADGSVESYYRYEEVFGQPIAPNLIAEDTLADGTWSAGKHYWTGNVCGKDIRVEVDVLSKEENPIKHISAVATQELVADWHWGSYMGENPFLQVMYSYPDVTVTLADGTKETIPYTALQYKYPGMEPKLKIDNDSLEGVGKRTATLEFYGHTCTFEVNVIENPVEKISAVTTKPLVEGWRPFYSLSLDGGLIVTAHYKDGRTVSCTPDEMMTMYNDYPTETKMPETVVLGKNTATITALGRTCDVEFEVVQDSNPVVGMDAKVQDGAKIYETTISNTKQYYKFDHLIDVTLHYKDGSTLSGTVDEVNQQLEDISINPVFTEGYQYENAWGIGKHTVEVSYMDFSKQVEVEVVENPYKKATISNEDGLTVVLEKTNGEKETYKANKFASGGSTGNMTTMAGYLTTDKGTLPVDVRYVGGFDPDYSNIAFMSIQGVKTNSLADCEWLEQQMITEMNGNVPEIKVNNSASELKDMALTDADYNAGRVDYVDVWLEASEKQGKITAEEQTLLDEAKKGEMANYKDGLIIDFTLYKKYGTMSGTEIEKVSEPNGKVSITMAVPEDVLASGTNPSTIKIIRIHEGKTEVLPCTYDVATKTITFETDAFSTYSLAYQGTGANTQPSSPNTGDNNVTMGYMTLCVAMLAVMYILRKKNILEK